MKKAVRQTVNALLMLCCVLIISEHAFAYSTTPLRVLQFNIWQEGTEVSQGFDAIIQEVIASNADLIALSEVRNFNQQPLNEKLVSALAKRGYHYYSEPSQDSGVLSRYPILKQEMLFFDANDHGSITKATILLQDVVITFYSAHLDWQHCSLYLPRGYHSSTWKKLKEPVIDTEKIAQDNKLSLRDEAITLLLLDSQKERAAGHLVILAGDFNEPSHLDWIEATKNSYDHHGVVMPWPNTLSLAREGFVDAYRAKFPDPVSHPGFTFPADNVDVAIEKLAWSPLADDRDRIDYIFFQPDNRLTLGDVQLIGPLGSIVKNQRSLEKSQDPITPPKGIWPSDHKAV
ncbi:MAG: endonuclease/exonuclease/phosphatase family protein, partial [Colwellia sp.]|nr:endonuclease/exonuclease/phosphatase family protein [Colwellia sp.]